MDMSLLILFASYLPIFAAMPIYGPARCNIKIAKIAKRYFDNSAPCKTLASLWLF